MGIGWPLDVTEGTSDLIRPSCFAPGMVVFAVCWTPVQVGGPLMSESAKSSEDDVTEAIIRLGLRIYDCARLTGEFRLRSGVVSSEYFDKYLFESDPTLLREIADALAGLVPDGADALAGLELGGVPLAVAISQVCGLPTLFVRKKAKQYGTGRLAEGGEVAGRHVVVVEDVVTSGGQVIESCRALRERDAEVAVVLCVIDREAGGRDKLAAAGLELRPLFTMSELRETADSRAVQG